MPLSALPPLLGAHNLSGSAFTLDAMMLLNRGLKFVPTPPCIKQQQLTAALQRFKRSVRLRCQFQDTGLIDKYKQPNPAFEPEEAPAAVEAFLSMVESAVLSRFDIAAQQHQQHQHKPNLGKAETAALRQFMHDRTHVQKPADKNLGLTIMRTAAYHTAEQQHVNDPKTYTAVTDTLGQVIQSACRQLKHLVGIYQHELGDTLAKFLLQGLKMTKPPHLYLMPKLHKMASLDSPIIGRPIAACHSWVTTCVSIWLADKLNGCLHEYDTVLKDRTQLVRELEGLRVSKNAWLFTFDVESLYPHVDHTGCINACAGAVHGSSKEKAMVQCFLQFVLENNVVSVQGKHYRQVFGGAMGTNCMPPAAQLYLAREWESVAKQRLGNSFPSVFRRFIDDGFVIFDGTEQELLAFASLLNNLLPNIKITHSYSQFEVDFLDVVVFKCMEDVCDADGKVRLKVRTHQKALNKYLYIPYDSFHHPGMFKSFINAELIRYIITNSDEWWYDCMVRKFTHRLRQRGYPLRMITSITNRVSYARRQQYLSSASNGQKPTGSSSSVLVLPYAQLIPEMRLQQLLRDEYEKCDDALHAWMPHRPIVAFTKNRNLGSFLVKASH